MATSINLDEALNNRVQHLADVRHCSAQSIMQEAISEYLEREEARDDFKQEAMKSWEAFQETGKHLTGQEVNDWLDTWGTDKEVTQPPCHE